ncbi:MAG: hypothetical protein HY543_02775 [Deltaproteobacteria bacterium]|nr:hypothetical protein [Deltaproteobacteria bacterium]
MSLPRADAELRRRLAEEPQRLERVSTSPLWPSRLDSCLNKGLRIEDDAAPEQLLDENRHVDELPSRRGLQLRIDEPRFIAVLCALDGNQDNVINSRDFSPRHDDVDIGVYKTDVRELSTRESMITTIAETLAQESGIAPFRPQLARGIWTLFKIYPFLHAMDESLLLMTRARRDTWGREFELGHDDYRRLVHVRVMRSTIDGYGLDLAGYHISGPDAIMAANKRLTQMFQDLYFNI